MDTLTRAELIARQLPPSGAALTLADIGGRLGTALLRLREDLHLPPVPDITALAALPESAVDAVAADGPPDVVLLAAALWALRPGGRLIVLDERGRPDPELVTMLEAAGFDRVLVESALSLDQPGVLLRGEKPHQTADTLARVDSVALPDVAAETPARATGRYLYLLVRQTPNKPPWALTPEDEVRWHAVAIWPAAPQLLVFSSLPAAVAFMQRAVLADVVHRVSKVGKFRRATIESWPVTQRLNPSLEDIAGASLCEIEVDPREAVRGGE